MAKILSPVWSSIRGSIAGTTYLTTPSGQIIARQRTKPTQPDTTIQNQARAAMNIAAADWNNTTQVIRDAWAAVAPTFGKTGRHLYISGRQLIEYINQRALITPAPVVTDDAPTVGSVPSFSMAQTVPTLPLTPTIEVNITNLQKVRTAFLVEISPPLQPARIFWKGPWVGLQTTAGVALSLGTKKITFANLVGGAFYVIRVRPVYAPASPDTLKGVIAGTVHYLRGTPTLPA